MTAVDHAELKRLERLKAICAFFDGDGSDTLSSADSKQHGQDLRALLSEIEGLKAERDAARQRTKTAEGLMRKWAAMIDSPDVQTCGLASSLLFGIQKAARSFLSTRTQAPDSWRPDREAVARIVDFQAWDFYDRHIGNPIMLAECKHEVGPSLAKADAILALRPQTAESGK